MTSQPVHPLRIQKSTPNTSPVKMGSSIPRALTELAPTERRQNSPSYNQGSPKKMAINMDSSPFQSSPFNTSEGNSSPRLFWQGRDPATPSNRFNSENGIFGKREMSPSPTRRSSIERLQRASRVKNSNMFAREQKQEYDPTSIPNIERPLAKQIQGNAYGGQGLDGLRSEERGRAFGHGRAPSKDIVSPYSPTKLPLTSTVVRESPTKEQTSPMKSSLATTRFGSKLPYDEDKISSPEYSGGEHELPEGRSLHRHAKSVTFDAAPQINEYEMVTPDLSSVGTNSRENSYDSAEDDDEESYNRSGSLELDDSFDASLEDTDKTPVVGPDDWRFSNNGGSSDPFGAQLEPSSPLTGSEISSPTVTRNISADHRPLPPLPGTSEKRNSGLFAAAERASNVTRGTAVPAASFSKTDIQGLTGGRMPLEERLRLMMIQDDDKAKPVAETQRERRMRRGGARDRCSATPEVDDGEIKIHEDEDTLADLGEYQLPERVSRESILRKVNGHDAFTLDSEYNFSSPPPSSRQERTTVPDPDVAIPSTEDVTIADDDSSVIIKPEEEDSEIDVYDIPEMYQGRPESRVEDYDINNSVVRDDSVVREGEDLESQYSDETPQNKSPELESNNVPEDEGPPTPRLTAPTSDIPSVDTENKEDQASLPALPGFLDTNNFGLSLQSYMTPTPPPPPPKDETSITSDAVIEPLDVERTSTPPGTPAKYALPKPDYDGAGWGSESEEEVGTPESVVHHAVSYEESPPAESPVVPEQTATIKSSSGSKLKTRPSATPSDIMAMREARRQISTEYPIPPIPQRHRNRPSQSMERDLEDPEAVSENEGMKRIPSLKRDGLTLDIGSDLGLSLDQDFDRLIEAQKVAFNLSHYHLIDSQGYHGQVSTLQAGVLKFEEMHANITPRKQRGYLMRQNTKVVVASSGTDVEAQNFRDTRSAGNSPVKQPRPQSWTVEPWNGSPRKRSTRDSTGGRKRMPSGPAPPLPGQQSNVAGTGLGMVAEDAQVDINEPDNGERGRLFVKVIGVKDLGLPLPKNERTWFALTLDNGVHCVTTAWLELGKNAPIGQEFELVVPNELEFQLTLNAKLQKPPPQRVVESPTKAKAPKPSTFSRVFTSPKKRKELEMRQKEEQQRAADKQQSEMAAKRMSQQPTAWDLLSPLAADDGSFGRSYVCLKDHEQHCFGRPYVVDVNCFNEWATEEVGGMSSVKSKTGATQTRRRAPYKVGKLELQLLFVPKPKGASDDDIPKSMNSCIRAMKEAEEAVARCHSGYLSQQGGDCPYWRRRMFKLNGSKLTAYHESTGQPRATINLANASKLIDDRRALTQKETTGRGGSRRKSGFAEEEEGYMFVEEGFRIRFGNGEVIDFYADTAKDKEGWMKVLDQCIGTSSEAKNGVSWCDMVLKREDSLKRKEIRKASGEKPPRFHARTKSMII